MTVAGSGPRPAPNPEGELESDQWVSSPKTDIYGRVSWQTAEGKLHRVGAPAVVDPDGTEEWYLHGKIHRTDGPASTQHGVEVWALHGKLHREGAPALIRPDGSEEWWQDNRPHRTDGPAATNSDGTLEWWEHGVRKPPEIEAALSLMWKARTPPKA